LQEIRWQIDADVYGPRCGEKSQTVSETSNQILKAIASLRKANNQLLEVIKNKKIKLNTIKEFGEDVADLSKGIKPYFKRF